VVNGAPALLTPTIRPGLDPVHPVNHVKTPWLTAQ
jgi:hypothetical protein